MHEHRCKIRSENRYFELIEGEGNAKLQRGRGRGRGWGWRLKGGKHKPMPNTVSSKSTLGVMQPDYSMCGSCNSKLGNYFAAVHVLPTMQHSEGLCNQMQPDYDTYNYRVRTNAVYRYCTVLSEDKCQQVCINYPELDNCIIVPYRRNKRCFFPRGG